MSQKVYVLCSRYSKASAEFLKVVDEYEIDIVIPVFIDTPEARDMVLSSALNIKSVPCVIGNVNGYFATYEGKDAFDWLAEIAKMYAKPDPPEAEIASPETVPERINAHVNHKLIDSRTLAEKMRHEREVDDDFLHDRKRIPKGTRGEMGGLENVEKDSLE